MNKYAIINPDAGSEILRGLKSLGMEPIPVEKTGLTAEPLAGHPDLQVFLCGKVLFCNPGIGKNFLKKVGPLLEIRIGRSILSPEYPGDAAYNVADTGSSVLHNPDHTDPALREHLAGAGRRFISVKQGYARCSTLIAGGSSIITSDRGIHDAAVKSGMESLLIEPGHIDLPGYRHGFIGGATGNVGDKILFTGSLRNHPDAEGIMEFIEMSGKRPYFLSEERIIDLGSLLIFEA